MFRSTKMEDLLAIGGYFLLFIFFGKEMRMEEERDCCNFIQDEKTQLRKTQQHGRQDNIIKTTIKVGFRQPEDRTKREEPGSLGCM